MHTNTLCLYLSYVSNASSLAMTANEVNILPNYRCYFKLFLINYLWQLIPECRVVCSYLGPVECGLACRNCCLVVCSIVSWLELLPSQPGLDGLRSGQTISRASPIRGAWGISKPSKRRRMRFLTINLGVVIGKNWQVSK